MVSVQQEMKGVSRRAGAVAACPLSAPNIKNALLLSHASNAAAVCVFVFLLLATCYKEKRRFF